MLVVRNRAALGLPVVRLSREDEEAVSIAVQEAKIINKTSGNKVLVSPFNRQNDLAIAQTLTRCGIM